MTFRSRFLARQPFRRWIHIATAVAILVVVPSVAFAKKPKKSAPLDDAGAPAADAAPAASPPPAPEPPPPPPPPAPEPASKPAIESVNIAAASEEPITYTTEDPNRYHGTIIPQFLENLFVDDGATVYSNSIGLELDMRKGGQSMIPWITYTDYGMGDTLFLTKGKDPNNAAQYSVVNSGLKAIYLGLDELWSVPVANHFDFEFGFGVGLGLVFGDLQNNWVYQTGNGPLVASNGIHLQECQSVNDSSSCSPGSHQNATVAKVAGYIEPNWFNGGSVPVIFPNIWFPTLGLRYKPIKMLETRLQAGFSLTGFWFGLSADYGLEKRGDNNSVSTRSPVQLPSAF
jgi:hypothetical protein